MMPRAARLAGIAASLAVAVMPSGGCHSTGSIANGAGPEPAPGTSLAAVDASAPCSIKVRFAGLKPGHGSGPIRVALWNSERDFMKDGRWIRAISIPIQNADEGAAFEGLPMGRYAISAFHDSRDAGTLRQGVFGIPIDPWAVSNTGTGPAPPAWRTASFELVGTETTVELDFLHTGRIRR